MIQEMIDVDHSQYWKYIWQQGEQRFNAALSSHEHVGY